MCMLCHENKGSKSKEVYSFFSPSEQGRETVGHAVGTK